MTVGNGPHILVVDDDPDVRDLVVEYLGKNDMRVSARATGHEMFDLIDREPIDLVLLDLKLEGEDGLHLARDLRDRATLPIVLLTGRNEEADRVMGLELGADDYVTKPFSITELLARVRAVLRRAGGRPSGLETCRIGDVEIDFRTHQAHRAGQRIDFTAREFDLLRYFVQHTGQVVTREQILNQVWGYEESPTTRTIDNFVAKLRQKIEKAPHEPEHILTVHGAGYKFVG